VCVNLVIGTAQAHFFFRSPLQTEIEHFEERVIGRERPFLSMDMIDIASSACSC
jgi:hypothetical protein